MVWIRLGLNPGPLGYESDALTIGPQTNHEDKYIITPHKTIQVHTRRARYTVRVRRTTLYMCAR